jgi:hypothetical protein
VKSQLRSTGNTDALGVGPAPVLSARSFAGDAVHFWTLREVTGVDLWDPDRAPARFPTGVGQVLHELYVRLRRRNRPVSIGERAPRESRVIVASLAELYGWRGHSLNQELVARFAAEAAQREAMVIRTDVPLAIASPEFVACEVMPNPTSVTDPETQRWIPLLPQRGMVRRSEERRGQVRRMALKSAGNNLPDYINDPDFRIALRNAGVTLRVDTNASSWPNFQDVDLALCVRIGHGNLKGALVARKPPTKLINAWVAGVIPLVAPEAGYLDLAREGIDALIVRSSLDVIDAVTSLQENPKLLEQLEVGVGQRGVEFAVDRVLRRWEDLLWAPSTEYAHG